MGGLADKSSLMSGDATAWRMMAVGALIGMLGPYGYEFAKQNLFDARRYYTYQSTEGPFEAVMANGELTAGILVSAAKPGDWVAWRTAICFAAGVAVTADTTLRAMPDGKIIQVSHTKVPAYAQCGPLIEGLQLPVDIPEGNYTIERLFRIEPVDAPAVTATVPDIGFRLER